MAERNDRHILHKVFTDVIPQEVQRKVLRDALEITGANIGAVRPERRLAKAEALERWFDQFQREIPVRVGGSVNQLREYLLKNFPSAIMSDLGRGDIRTVGRNTKGYEAILREQEDAREALSPTESEALIWKQKSQVRALAPWYSYLTTNDAAGEFKDIPWFRPYVVSTISSTLKKVVDGKATTARREPDTRDEVPHFDAGILALVYDKVKSQLQATHFNERKQEEQFEPNWNIDFWRLWADATAERIAQGEKYKEKVPKGDWLKITDATFLSEVSVHTPWCLAGKSTAESYLTPDTIDGETYPKAVWVFFDENKNPAIGLHACEIAKDRWEIRQIRGADDGQHLGEVLSKQLDGFINGDKVQFTNSQKYREQIHDHQLITELSRHIALETFDRLSVVEQRRLLKILYEIDRPIQSFGYGRDPRIDALRKNRAAMKVQDAESIFGKIAKTPDEIDSDTKAYIGPLATYDEKGNVIATLFPLPKDSHVEHIYASFPGRKRTRRHHELQLMLKENIVTLLKRKGVSMIGAAQRMVGNIPEKDLKETGSIETATVRVRDLFTDKELETFKQRGKGPTTDEIFDVNNKGDRYKKLGLDLCTGKDAVQILYDEAGHTEAARTLSNGQWASLAMERFSDGVDPSVFDVGRNDVGTLELGDNWAKPDNGWSLDFGLVFRLRK